MIDREELIINAKSKYQRYYYSSYLVIHIVQKWLWGKYQQLYRHPPLSLQI